MISNTLKINAIILFAVVLTASGGALIKQKTQIVDSYTNLKSNPSLSDINMYPQLKFHPHSKHYIYNFDTVEDTDKREFKDLASKLSQLPSNFPSKITLATVAAPSVASSEVLNPGELLTNRELYLISKYWLQLLPQFNSELLKCLAGPTDQSTSITTESKDQFPSNCPSEIRYLNPNTEESLLTITITNPSFNIPQTLYSKVHQCLNPKCQAESKDCYCTEKSCGDCSDANSCKCFDISELTIGPRFFALGSFNSKFSYPSQPQSPQNPLQTFNATDTTKPSNHSSLPHFTFPLPHSSHTQNKIKNSIDPSEGSSFSNPANYPQDISFNSSFIPTLNKQNSYIAHFSLDSLVQTMLVSSNSFQTSNSKNSNIKLIKNSPTHLFFVRYLTTLYSLLWEYYPNALPLFPPKEKNLFFQSSTFSNTSPLFHQHHLP